MNSSLRLELKTLIVEAVRQGLPTRPTSATTTCCSVRETLSGFDSLDALARSMAIKKKYGLRLPDSKETRRILSSVANMAEHLAAWLASRR